MSGSRSTQHVIQEQSSFNAMSRPDMVYLNGLLLTEGGDYMVDEIGVVSLSEPAQIGDVVDMISFNDGLTRNPKPVQPNPFVEHLDEDLFTL